MFHMTAESRWLGHLKYGCGEEILGINSMICVITSGIRRQTVNTDMTTLFCISSVTAYFLGSGHCCFRRVITVVS